MIVCDIKYTITIMIRTNTAVGLVLDCLKMFTKMLDSLFFEWTIWFFSCLGQIACALCRQASACVRVLLLLAMLNLLELIGKNSWFE